MRYDVLGDPPAIDGEGEKDVVDVMLGVDDEAAAAVLMMGRSRSAAPLPPLAEGGSATNAAGER